MFGMMIDGEGARDRKVDGWKMLCLIGVKGKQEGWKVGWKTFHPNQIDCRCDFILFSKEKKKYNSLFFYFIIFYL